MSNGKRNLSKNEIKSDGFTKKANSKFEHEELVEDLKKSLKLIMRDASDTFTNLEDALSSKVQNDQIKKDTKAIKNHLQIEFEKSVNIALDKIVNSYNKNSVFKE
tara:strand:+ start:679 stop:993 length:315 start_codon:yes stop_codon:yes gene_type:complete